MYVQSSLTKDIAYNLLIIRGTTIIGVMHYDAPMFIKNYPLSHHIIRKTFCNVVFHNLVTLYNTGALICINSCLTNAQIIMS